MKTPILSFSAWRGAREVPREKSPTCWVSPPAQIAQGALKVFLCPLGILQDRYVFLHQPGSMIGRKRRGRNPPSGLQNQSRTKRSHQENFTFFTTHEKSSSHRQIHEHDLE